MQPRETIRALFRGAMDGPRSRASDSSSSSSASSPSSLLACTIDVVVTSERDVVLPRYETEGAAGMDLRADLAESVTLLPLGRAKIPTGLSMAIPMGFEGQVRPRSGMAAKHGLTVLNAPGTIDSDYRGELVVLVVNLGSDPVVVQHGDRIAQLVICPVARAELRGVNSLPTTERGQGGYGSTGTR